MCVDSTAIDAAPEVDASFPQAARIVKRLTFVLREFGPAAGSEKQLLLARFPSSFHAHLSACTHSGSRHKRGATRPPVLACRVGRHGELAATRLLDGVNALILGRRRQRGLDDHVDAVDGRARARLLRRDRLGVSDRRLRRPRGADETNALQGGRRDKKKKRREKIRVLETDLRSEGPLLAAGSLRFGCRPWPPTRACFQPGAVTRAWALWRLHLGLERQCVRWRRRLRLGLEGADEDVGLVTRRGDGVGADAEHGQRDERHSAQAARAPTRREQRQRLLLHNLLGLRAARAAERQRRRVTLRVERLKKIKIRSQVAASWVCISSIEQSCLLNKKFRTQNNSFQ
eukprot:1707815-Pleurochrysis_carterae.AAC.1